MARKGKKHCSRLNMNLNRECGDHPKDFLTNSKPAMIRRATQRSSLPHSLFLVRLFSCSFNILQPSNTKNLNVSILKY
jgi:hypothetical protein